MKRHIFIGLLFLLAAPNVFAQIQFNNRVSSICDISPDDSLYLYIRSCYCWKDIDARKALDTCRLYVERHPYATVFPGEVTSAIDYTIGFVNELPNVSKADWIDNYNWLVKVLPINNEAVYQYVVLATMADNLRQIDLNEAANMWWNISLLYSDSGSVALCWRNIKSIRDFEKWIPKDTTPFHKLTFPLQPMPGGTNSLNPQKSTQLRLVLNPNPAKDVVVITYELPDRVFLNAGLFDILGKEMKKISNATEERGLHVVSVNTHDLSPGSYYVRLEYPGGVITKSLIVEH